MYLKISLNICGFIILISLAFLFKSFAPPFLASFIYITLYKKREAWRPGPKYMCCFRRAKALSRLGFYLSLSHGTFASNLDKCSCFIWPEGTLDRRKSHIYSSRRPFWTINSRNESHSELSSAIGLSLTSNPFRKWTFRESMNRPKSTPGFISLSSGILFSLST